MSMRLNGKLPDSVQKSGMDWIEEAMVQEPDRPFVVVLRISAKTVTETYTSDGPVKAPTAQILQAEPIVSPELERQVIDAMERERRARMGEELDFTIDPGTGEVRDANVTSFKAGDRK